jgi:hypothetical protein
MSAPQILAAVGPRTTELAGDAIRRHGDVLVAETLDDALRMIGENRFSLIISSVDFDESRMLDLLAHCGHLPIAERPPFLCVRSIAGHLPEHTYADIRKTASFLGARYIDLTHWIDSKGLQGAVNDFEGVVATLLRSRLTSDALCACSVQSGRDPGRTTRVPSGPPYRR